MLYIDELNKVIDFSEKKVEQVIKSQKVLEKKVSELEGIISSMEKELFVEDEYDFEITCPYCNYEFVTDINSDKTEIECPECHNLIELDWNHEEGHDCGGQCGACAGCEHEEDNVEQESNDEDDDM